MNRQQRAHRLSVIEHKHYEIPPEDEQEPEDEGGIDGEAEERTQIGPLDCMRLRDGGSVNLRDPWELPR